MQASMGIGRRDFLKAFGATIAAYAAGPLQPVVLGDAFYINRSLGLAFRQPPGWGYLSLKEFPQLKHAQVLEDDVISSELLSGADPFVAMTRPEPARRDDVGASMTAYAEEFAFEPGESLSKLPRMTATVLSRVLKDYELLGEGELISVSGVQSIEYFARFQFITGDLSVPARQRTVAGVRGGAIFTFNFFDYPAVGVDAQEDFDTILRSLTYA
jgi:hypothetical protein